MVLVAEGNRLLNGQAALAHVVGFVQRVEHDEGTADKTEDAEDRRLRNQIRDRSKNLRH